MAIRHWGKWSALVLAAHCLCSAVPDVSLKAGQESKGERRADENKTAKRKPAAKDEDHCFHRTRVIGYSQVGSRRWGGWFVADGIFESIVGDDRWELLWAGGAGVDRWRDPNYRGWSQPLVSPCPTDRPPDRVLLSVSGPYGSNEKVWAEAITETVENIRKKIPSARQIILQPVVGGPGGKACRSPRGGKVRASWQHKHIESAIKEVVKHYAKAEVQVLAGYSPCVRTPADYADGLGHLTFEGAKAAGRAIGEYYARWDAECSKAGHVRCGKHSSKKAPREQD